MEYVKPRKFYYVLHPRPTVVIISRCPNTKYNIMTASWVTPVSEEPPTIAIAIDKEAYTNQCLESHRESTINIPTIEHVDVVYSVGSISGRDVDKISKYKIELENSKNISVPRWRDAACWYETKVVNYLDIGEVRLYIFEVLDHYCKKDVVTEWGWNTLKTSPILHGVGRIFYYVGKYVRAKS